MKTMYHTSGPWTADIGNMDAWPNDRIKIMDSDQGIIAEVLCHTSCGTTEDNSRVIAASPELLEACEYAAGLIKIARQYFPKSMRNNDKFQLENTCAAIGGAIHKARGEQ